MSHNEQPPSITDAEAAAEVKHHDEDKVVFLDAGSQAKMLRTERNIMYIRRSSKSTLLPARFSTNCDRLWLGCRLSTSASGCCSSWLVCSAELAAASGTEEPRGATYGILIQRS